jgi:hypothetical protein
MELHHPAIGLNLYNLFLDRYLSLRQGGANDVYRS